MKQLVQPPSPGASQGGGIGFPAALGKGAPLVPA